MSGGGPRAEDTKRVPRRLALGDPAAESLQYAVVRDVPLVHADVRLLERVLENLITNALQHTPAGGRVEVTVCPDNADGARVTVEDSGCGIAEQDIPRIFDRTFRSDVSRSEGAGLGLAIAQRALELHSSHIAVTSTVGEGTTFSFDLPS